MSYILDALRKAEGERRRTRVPTLDADHALPPKRVGRAWPWVVVVVLVLNVATFVWVVQFRQTDAPPTPARAAVTAAPAVSAPAWPAEAPTAVAAPREATPPVDPPRPDTRAPVAVAPPVGSPATTSTDRAARQPTAEARTVESAIPPPPVPAPPPIMVPVPAPAPATLPGAQPAGPPPVPARPPRDPAVALGEAVQGLSLDVLVYSEAEAQRMVFINSRKYVEGQQVDGKLLLEAITPEGAILRFEGQRYLLRPRTNPYVR